MEFTEVTIYTTTAGIDRVEAMLEQLEIEGYVLEDAADFQAFLHDPDLHWDYVDEALVEQKSTQETNLKIYLTQDETGASQLAGLRRALEDARARDTQGAWGRLTCDTGVVRQEEWEWGWKQYWKPFAVGTRFFIKPTWETLADAAGRMVMEIDPASSFGTGSHETTQLCIAALEQVVQAGNRVLDMGTGSGILAIAAAMLGAQVDAVVDIDEHCLQTAQQNAQNNGVCIGACVCGDVIQQPALQEKLGEGYDVILANIVADVIIAMAPLFVRKLRAGGTLICSGVLDIRAEQVHQALVQAGLQVHTQVQAGDWVCFTARTQ